MGKLVLCKPQPVGYLTVKLATIGSLTKTFQMLGDLLGGAREWAFLGLSDALSAFFGGGGTE